MKRAAFLLLTLGALGLGCAPAPPVQSPDSGAFIGYLTPHRGTYAWETYKITTNGISSPSVQIGRSPDGFIGRVRQASIEMHVANHEVTGALGSGPIHLTMAREGDGILVQGLYGGRGVAFRLGRPTGKPTTPMDMNITSEPAQPPPAEEAPAAAEAPAPVDAPAAAAGAPPAAAVADARAQAETVRGMMTKLNEDEALALLAVILLNGTSGSIYSPTKRVPAGPALTPPSPPAMRPHS
jgi:hypothetical protein